MFKLKQVGVVIFLCLFILGYSYVFAAGDDYHSYIDKADGYFHNNQYREAISSLEKAIQRDPSGFLANAKLASTYVKMGEFDKSVPYFKKALLAEPDNSLVNFGLGSAYLTLNQSEKALDCFQNVSDSSLLAETHWGIGSAYLKLKRYDEAVTYFNKALTGGYNEPITYLGLGTSYYYLRQFDQARNNLLKAKEMYRAKGNTKAIGDIDLFLSTIPQR